MRRRFVPFNYLSEKAEGVTIFPPSLSKFDLVHAFNRIPLGTRPFVIGFESHLPRGFGIEGSLPFRLMTDALVSSRCRGIVALSGFAERMFLHQHRNHPQLERLRLKLTRRFPSLPIRKAPAEVPPAKPLRLLFVGAHFARKGGLVALRAAEMAAGIGLSLRVDIVSDMTVGAASWTDPSRGAYFEPYWKLLDRPNVVRHGALPNARVLELMRASHFVVLPTFGDTFGYSAAEALAQGVPIIATNQGALPEFVEDGVNGILLDLPTDTHGEWIHLGAPDRNSQRFERVHREAVEVLAQALVQRLHPLAERPDTHRHMRDAALSSAKRHFDEEVASTFWDALYERAAQVDA